MQEYKGIKRSANSRLFSYIDTYHILDRDNYKSYLENDKPLQKLVQRHYKRVKLYKILFNISIYIVFYILAIIVKG